MFDRFKRKIVLYYWDYKKSKSEDESESKPGGVSGIAKYDINISKNGRHIFATDSTIRNYSSAQARDIILLFRETFP